MKPNYTIAINDVEYLIELKKRLIESGINDSDIPRIIDSHSEPLDLTQMVLISLILQQNFDFLFFQSYSSHNTKASDGKRTYRLIPSSVGFREERSFHLKSLLQTRRIQKISLANLKFVISSLERYFRTHFCEIDRMSSALSFLWSAITAKSQEQMFLNLTILLECLLSTGQKTEITHLLSERAAILIGTNDDERDDIYGKVKNIYKQRSKIVHGSSVPKRGKITRETFVIAPTIKLVPKSELEWLAQLSFDLINIVLCDKELLSTIQQSGKREEKKDKELDKFFLRRLMATNK